jgi:subtilase family serine protease
MVNFVGKVKRCATGKLRFPGATAALLIVLGALMLGSLPSPAFAQHVLANRINGPIRTAQRQTIRGTVHPLVARSQDEGQLAGSTMIHGMSLVFRRSAAQEAELKNLLREQQTPGSPQYHQWLKPGQFAARFGMSDQDLAKAAEWLKSQGFQIDGIPASRDRVNFSGTAAQVDATFQANLHRYRHNGHARWANAMNIEVPDAIAPMTLRIAHLNTFRPRPQVARTPVHAPVRAMASGVRTHYTLQDQSGREINLLAPADIATIYDVNGLYNNGITGKGQAIAVAGQTDIVQYQSDIAHFRSLSGLDATNLPQQVVVPNSGPATVYPLDLEEADIDVEWAGAVAQDATIVYVTVGSNQSYSAFDSMEYAIQTPLLANGGYVPIISISYGNCEQVFTTQEIQGVEQFLEQAAAQGQTVLAASGDSGSADCDNTG